MTIVMGLDQHRAQVTADWLDTETGELKRGRIAPADRTGVARFLSRFGGQELDVASRSRPPPAGASLSRSSTGSVPGCTWPSRRKLPRDAARRSTRRTTALMPGTCASY